MIRAERKSALRHAVAGEEAISFVDLIGLIDGGDFEASAALLLEALDANGTKIECEFLRRRGRSVSRSRDLLGFYRAEVQRIPVMNREEEQAFCMGVEVLWRRLRAARVAAGFPAADLEHHPGLEQRPCRDCAPGMELYCHGCAPIGLADQKRERLRARTQEFVQARNELIERNLHIVFRLLQRYRGVGVPLEDLVQEANHSLFKAVEGFDFRRGVRFKTYAGYWVNQAFLNAIYNQSRTVRVPAYIQKAMKKINDAASTVGTVSFDREAIARESGVPTELVDSALNGNRMTLSLDKSIDDGEGGARMVDLVEDESPGLDYEAMEESHLGEHLAEAIGLLNQREQTILKLRFGLDREPARTLSEVGERLGISLERVRQIQKAALGKIRNGAKRRMLEQYA